MYLWQDAKRPGRALLWISTPALTSDPAVPNMMIADISKVAAGGPVTEVTQGGWNQLLSQRRERSPLQRQPVHPTRWPPPPTAPRTYLAEEAREFLVLDTSAVADDTVSPGTVASLNNDLVTDPANRPIWGNPLPGYLKVCPEGHSSVPIPGRPYVLTTDEIFGTFTDRTFAAPGDGCT
jgi:hypothetical protein